MYNIYLFAICYIYILDMIDMYIYKFVYTSISISINLTGCDKFFAFKLFVD